MIVKQLKSAIFGLSAFVLCAVSASAGSVTYDFIEGPDAPNPGTVGAFFVFASPPASAMTGWSTNNTADVLNFEITDPKIGQVGSYTIGSVFVDPVVSQNGTSLDNGQYLSFSNIPSALVLVILGSTPNSDRIQNGVTTTGNFVLAPVPEPSSLMLAGTAALAGLGCWMRRRGR
jgi:PEP-CTERM motif